MMTKEQSPNVRAVAFYLPQYHPIPENDHWWGKGFTEWTNVTKARPLFPGHYQPHLPADLGFYDLRLAETREAQAALAKTYGIYGFCYYHYWFNGRRVLETPFNSVFSSGKPDFPFCLCWANENWTRTWDGLDQEILLAQHYSKEDDLAHIRALIPYFFDDRYIKIDGRPLVLIYRAEKIPDPRRLAELWRAEASRHGLPDLYLVRVESFVVNVDPREIGFDAAVEFAPYFPRLVGIFRTTPWRELVRFGVLPEIYLKHTIARYDSMVQYFLGKPEPNYPWFRCVTPGFDNTARRAEGAAIIVDSTPDKYRVWLEQIVRWTRCRRQGEERIVFINAWNEWAEGNHLEPDRKWGHGYLEATQRALAVPAAPENGLETTGYATARPPADTRALRYQLKRFYWDLHNKGKAFRTLLNHIGFRMGQTLLDRFHAPHG
ncbi:glycoside hydrolase family 99-like domain-containing protein [Candidatus Methylocalor cossyra]|uniref:Glycosyltransferase WbsX n=1 Tax=Candidatus Methylocalor cossyra TaxID=3108543 RepID=A0ABM9NH71_9GAMM